MYCVLSSRDCRQAHDDAEAVLGEPGEVPEIRCGDLLPHGYFPPSTGPLGLPAALVFAGFIGVGESMIKMIGFGLAITVLFDAFVVRMAIVPAILALLGDKAWYLPHWLDRMLPRVDVEGEALTRHSPTVPAGSQPTTTATTASTTDPAGLETARV